MYKPCLNKINCSWGFMSIIILEQTILNEGIRYHLFSNVDCWRLKCFQLPEGWPYNIETATIPTLDRMANSINIRRIDKLDFIKQNICIPSVNVILFTLSESTVSDLKLSYIDLYIDLQIAFEICVSNSDLLCISEKHCHAIRSHSNVVDKLYILARSDLALRNCT